MTKSPYDDATGRPLMSVPALKATQGPWIIEPNDPTARGHWIHDDRAEFIALVTKREIGGPAEELANAHLVANSRSLYAALEALVEACIKDFGEPHPELTGDGPVAEDLNDDWSLEGSALTFKHIRDGIAALKAARGE